MATNPQWVTFHVGAQTYALPVGVVREIVRAPHITPIPEAAEYVAGVTNLRGRIVPVVDLRRKLEQAAEASPKNRLLVSTVNGKLTGLIVDAPCEVLKLSPSQVEPGAKLFGDSTGTYIDGIARHRETLVVLLDIEKLLQKDCAPEATLG